MEQNPHPDHAARQQAKLDKIAERRDALRAARDVADIADLLIEWGVHKYGA